MKKFSKRIRVALANMLIWLAVKLTPEAQKRLVQQLKHYKAQQIGTAWGITKKDINRYKEEFNEKNHEAAKEGTIGLILEEQKKAIFETASKLIEYRTYNKHGQTIVESRLNVYVPTKADTEEA